MSIRSAQNIYHTFHLTTTIGCPPANDLFSYTMVDSQKCLSIVYINASVKIASSIPFNCIYTIDSSGSMRNDVQHGFSQYNTA